MPQLDFSFYLSQIAWLLVCFGLFFCISKFLILPRLEKNLYNRANKIKSNIDFSEQMLERAKIINEKNDKKIKKTQDEIEKTITEFVKNKQEESENRIKEALNKSNQEIQQSILDEKRKIEEIKKDLQVSIVDIVVNILENVYLMKNIDRKEIEKICNNKFNF